MAIEVFNRYETKFLLNREQLFNLQGEISKHMRLDEYNLNKEFYTISNIYYDTNDDFLIRSSLAKPLYKEKVRLRAYGVPKAEDKVFLEIKKKYNSIVNKRRTSIYIDDAKSFIAKGVKPELKPFMNEQVVNELEYTINFYNLMPKAYIAYDRKAYFGIDDPNFRLTIDTNIRTRRTDLRLEAGDFGNLLLSRGQYLMEVKTAGGIPDWLARALSENGVFKTSFSKYGTEYTKHITESLIYRQEKAYRQEADSNILNTNSEKNYNNGLYKEDKAYA